MACGRAHAGRREPQGHAAPDAGRRRRRHARAAQGSASAVPAERRRSIHHVIQDQREAAARSHERDLCDSALPRGGGRRLFRRRAAVVCSGNGPAICGAFCPISRPETANRRRRAIRNRPCSPAMPMRWQPPCATHRNGWIVPICGPRVWCATKPDGGQSRGKRHVIVLSSAEEGRIAGHGLIANLQGGRIPLQAIASGPNAQLQEFCRRTHILVPDRRRRKRSPR